MPREIDGVLVNMSAGRYTPKIQTIDWTDAGPGRFAVCEYGSQMALDAGLSNPRHWAHAVYRTLERLCAEHQEDFVKRPSVPPGAQP